MVVENLSNSFVRFNEPETVSNFRREVQIAYPAYDADDYHFLFRVTGSLLDITGLVLDPTQVRLGFTVDKLTLQRDWYAVDSLAPIVFQENDSSALLAWPHGLAGLAAEFSAGDCFYIGMMNIASMAWMASSNLFKRVGTNKLTVVLEYWSAGESFGFPYCELEPFHNKARIPAYIGAPQFTSKEDVYRKSDGELVSLNAIVGKQYTMKTAFLPEEIHWPTNVALSHEKIRVTDDRYDMMVKKNGQYDVSWPEAFEPILAPATVKLDMSGVPDSSGAGCGCLDFVECTDVDFIAMEAGVGQTHQIEVVTSCDDTELLYEVTYEDPLVTVTVGSTGFVNVVPDVGTFYPSLQLMGTVKVTCGTAQCSINFYSIVF